MNLRQSLIKAFSKYGNDQCGIDHHRMHWSCFVIVIVCCSLIQVRSFAWDKLTIQTVFANSEDVFSTLQHDHTERVCVDEFKKFVDDLKINQEWALLGKFFSGLISFSNSIPFF